MIEAIGGTMIFGGLIAGIYYSITSIDEMNIDRERRYIIFAVISIIIAFGGIHVFEYGKDKRLVQEVKEIRQEMEQTVDAITEGI